MIRKRAAFALTALTFSAFALPAFAEKTALSDLPIMPAAHDRKTPPKDYGVPGLVISQQKRDDGSTWTEKKVETKQGYCYVSRDGGFMMSDEMYTVDETAEIWRFTTKDDGAALERTHFQYESYLDNAWTKSRNTTSLRAVAKENGITVWALHEATGDLIFLADGAFGGREGQDSPESGARAAGMVLTHSSCTYGATRIPAYALAHDGGGIAQLTGFRPKSADGKSPAKQWVADISATKLSRDPEPMITVRVRVAPT